MNRYGYDGQLGCAAVTFTSSEASSGLGPDAQELDTVRDLEKWATTNASALPGYAVPRFLRVLATGRNSPANVANNDTGADRVSLIMKKLKTGLRSEGESWYGPSSYDLVLIPVVLNQALHYQQEILTECTGSKRRVRDTCH